ncbi:hypothetical protein CDD80_221 [Ophiocordyceps camponoti-rufipedis]|uniref:Endo-chitosanase n=1 Tax=Ophiocordyceps camponoti-rufipedis TaxID=2004952 RepID=A0A2C5YLH1_9HYPO|nr:hypothetical protein CDD80_221 [Ophiocordyceps camponoti-rufipedis]
MILLSWVLISLLATPSLTRQVPPQLRTAYNTIKSRDKCKTPLAKGFHSSDNDKGGFTYCADHLQSNQILYLRGSSHQLTNMDIDCDGDASTPFTNDTRCRSSLDTQSQTTFRDQLLPYGIPDLNANIHTYVVFGNTASKPGWPTFDPASHGIRPLSVMAVVCGQRLVYGIWGDTNGDDGENPMVGEASISLATACYGDSVHGDRGHDENDVLYLAFPGEAAVPGPDGAAWNASDSQEFERSLEPIGHRLVSGIGDVSAGRKLGVPRAAGRLLVAGVTLAGLAV